MGPIFERTGTDETGRAGKKKIYLCVTAQATAVVEAKWEEGTIPPLGVV